MSETAIHFQATFPRANRTAGERDRVQSFIDRYVEHYGPMVRNGRQVQWMARVDLDARATEFDTTPAQELAWTLQAYAENVGYFGSDEVRKATLAHKINDGEWSTPRPCPMSY
jgi:hypothetical protein